MCVSLSVLLSLCFSPCVSFFPEARGFRCTQEALGARKPRGPDGPGGWRFGDQEFNNYAAIPICPVEAVPCCS